MRRRGFLAATAAAIAGLPFVRAARSSRVLEGRFPAFLAPRAREAQAEAIAWTETISPPVDLDVNRQLLLETAEKMGRAFQKTTDDLLLRELGRGRFEPVVLGRPAWVRCGSCEGYECRIHGGHAHDCPCPPVEEWPLGVSPYLEGGP